MEIKNVINDIKTYIDSEQVKNKIALDLGLKFKNNKCLCFLHGESNPSMSFDSKKKKFRCFSCGQSYDIFNHYQEYYDKSFVEAVKSIISDFNMNIELDIDKTDRKAKKPPTTHNLYTDKILSYCNKRGISQKTLDYVGVKEKENCVVFEYRNELGEHVSNKYRRTKQNKGPKMWFEKDTNINTLFNMDKVNPGEPLLITEGEFDCLSAIESGFKNAVSIPSGVNSTNEWLTTNWTFLEQFEEIIIWLYTSLAPLSPASSLSNQIIISSNCSRKVQFVVNHSLVEFTPLGILTAFLNPDSIALKQSNSPSVISKVSPGLTLSMLNKVFILVSFSNHIFGPLFCLVLLYLFETCSPSSFLYSNTTQFSFSLTPT